MVHRRSCATSHRPRTDGRIRAHALRSPQIFFAALAPLERLDDHEAGIAERGGDPEREEVDDDHARGVPSGRRVIATLAHIAFERWLRITNVLSGPSGRTASSTSL